MLRLVGLGRVGSARARQMTMVNELVELKVTAGLLRVLNGCAAMEVGQGVWLKLEPFCGARVDLQVNEMRFIHTWVEESIKVAEEMTSGCTCGNADPDHELIVKELSVLRSVKAELPPVVRRGARSRWRSLESLSTPWRTDRQ